MLKITKKKTALSLIFLAAVAGGSLAYNYVYAQFANTEAGPQKGLKRAPLTIKTSVGDKVFSVEIADNEESREIGLMWRTLLLANEGMIFDFKTPKYAAFWMKNTLIPLDILFIREDGTIARIAHNAKPHDLTPVESGEPILAVLELKGGEAAAQNISEGDHVEFPIFKGK